VLDWDLPDFGFEGMDTMASDNDEIREALRKQTKEARERPTPAIVAAQAAQRKAVQNADTVAARGLR
jgi:hypothetical protein